MAKLGSSSRARFMNGTASASPLVRAVVMPMLYAFRASSEGVVASTGTSNLCTEASDSPSLARMAVAAVVSALSTPSLLGASACSLARLSPVLQATASRPRMYWLPRLEMDPPRTALLPVRRQSSRATSAVTCSVGARPISFSVSPTLRSERMLRNGDCSRSTARACLRVPSKTGSPVELVKSARTTVSFSVRGAAFVTGIAHSDFHLGGSILQVREIAPGDLHDLGVDLIDTERVAGAAIGGEGAASEA